jgi:hypothetical protein
MPCWSYRSRGGEQRHERAIENQTHRAHRALRIADPFTHAQIDMAAHRRSMEEMMPSIRDDQTIDVNTDHASRQLLNLANAFRTLIGDRSIMSALFTVYLNVSLEITDVEHVEKMLRFAIGNLPKMKEIKDISFTSHHAGTA